MNQGHFCVYLYSKRFTIINKSQKQKEMKHIITIALIICAHTIFAQTTEPQKVESYTRVKHPVEWYKQQAALWRENINKNNKDESAWHNYLKALHFVTVFEESKSTLEQRNNAVKELIITMPACPTRYIMEYYIRRNDLGFNDKQLVEKVLETIKSNMQRVEFYENYIGFLLIEYPHEKALIADICRRWYESGDFSSGILNHFYNELAGIPQNSVIFATGDTPTFAYLILQHAKGLFKNIVTVSAPLLYTKKYQQHICNELGIDPIGADIGFDNGKGGYISNEEACLYIIEKSKRPAYYSSSSKLPSFTDKLYCEGLVFHYSTTPYDNTAVKRRNFEDVYLVDYLREEFTHEYPIYERIKLNYITAFGSLLKYYKECNNSIRQKELDTLLRGIISNNKAIDQQTRQHYYDKYDSDNR